MADRSGLSGRLRWATVIVDLDPTVGHEQAGQRRALAHHLGHIPAVADGAQVP